MTVMGFITAPGPMELIVVLVIALIVLGPKRLPETARSIGRGMREMRDALSSDDDEDEEDGVLDPPEPAEPAEPAARA
jgi:sec-independent protein translocase protein TatA